MFRAVTMIGTTGSSTAAIVAEDDLVAFEARPGCAPAAPDCRCRSVSGARSPGEGAISPVGERRAPGAISPVGERRAPGPVEADVAAERKGRRVGARR
jgi:hypothetical protein